MDVMGDGNVDVEWILSSVLVFDRILRYTLLAGDLRLKGCRKRNTMCDYSV